MKKVIYVCDKCGKEIASDMIEEHTDGDKHYCSSECYEAITFQDCIITGEIHEIRDMIAMPWDVQNALDIWDSLNDIPMISKEGYTRVLDNLEIAKKALTKAAKEKGWDEE